MKTEYDERTEEILAEVVRDALQSDADNMRSLNNQESSASSKQIRQSVKKVNKKMSSDTSTKSVSTKDVKSAKTKSTKKAKFNKETKTENAKSSTRRTGNVLPPVVNDQREGALIAPPKYRKGSMRIVPLGGLGEIGRNMNVIEYNGHILLIDCGVLFPEEEQPGVDLILPDFHYIQDRLDKVEALVLTHGHEDHIGGVPYLLKMRPDIPLIGSKLTLAFVEAKCKDCLLYTSDAADEQ